MKTFLLSLFNRLQNLTREQRAFLAIAGAVIALLAVVMKLTGSGSRAARAPAKLAAAHEAGKPGLTADYIAYWMPRAALGEIIVVALLMLSVKWLARPVPPGEPAPAPEPGDRRANRALLAVTALTIALSAVFNAPRLDHSLWGDEDATVRKSVVGQFHRNAEGKMEFDPVTWQETFFKYRDPNNHFLNSVLARASHTLFARDLTKPDGFYFDERALRLPVFVAGLAGLAALAWLAKSLGQPALGCAAVPLMALHPWFVRYGVEARGYGLLLLITPLALTFLTKAAQTARWRWWTAFGGAQFLILWSYPGSVTLLAALNVSAVLTFLAPGRSRPAEWRKAQAGRWLVATVIGAGVSTLMLLPCVRPLLFYLKTPRMKGPMPAEWYGEALSWLTTGMALTPWDAENPLCRSLTQYLARQPALAWPGLALLALLFVAGLVWWWRRGGAARLLLPALTLCAPLFLLQSHAMKSFIYPWYLHPALPGVVLILAGGAAFVHRAAARPLKIPALAAAVAVFGALTFETNGILRRHPVEGMREGVKLTRAVSLPSDPRIDEAMTLDILMSTQAYDPAMLPLEGDDLALLRRYMEQSDREGRPLSVHYGSEKLARSVRPQVMAVLEDPRVFEPVAVLPGLDEPYTRVVRRYKPGAAALLPPEAP